MTIPPKKFKKFKKKPPTFYNKRCNSRETAAIKGQPSVGVGKKASDIRRRLKSLLGNKCFCCGYSTCLRALEFHHIKKLEKSFNISESVLKYTWREILEELSKTVLVCSNCHSEIEDEIRFIRKKDISKDYYSLVKEAIQRSGRRQPKNSNSSKKRITDENNTTD